MSRFDDAISIVQTCLKLDPHNGSIESLLGQVEGIKKGAAGGRPPQGSAQSAFGQAMQMVQNKQTNEALRLLDQLLVTSSNDSQAIMNVAQVYVQLGQIPRAEMAMQKLVAVTPDNPEAWYNLGGLQAAQGKIGATQAMQKAFDLSAARLKKDPTATDLRAHAKTDANLEPIRHTPEFQKLVGK